MGTYTARAEDHLVLPARACLTTDQRDVHDLLGRGSSEPTDVRLLIDTGSSRSTLVPWVIDHLRPLVAQDRLRIETSLASGEATLFWVRLEFPETSLAPIDELAVARLALPLSLQQFHGVAGRDLLRRWSRLSYEGRRARLTIKDAQTSLFDWFR
jgi:hypothetical protein